MLSGKNGKNADALWQGALIATVLLALGILLFLPPVVAVQWSIPSLEVTNTLPKYGAILLALALWALGTILWKALSGAGEAPRTLPRKLARGLAVVLMYLGALVELALLLLN